MKFCRVSSVQRRFPASVVGLGKFVILMLGSVRREKEKKNRAPLKPHRLINMKMSFCWNEFAQWFPICIHSSRGLNPFTYAIMYWKAVDQRCKITLYSCGGTRRDEFRFIIYWNHIQPPSSCYASSTGSVMNSFSSTNTNRFICVNIALMPSE